MITTDLRDNCFQQNKITTSASYKAATVCTVKSYFALRLQQYVGHSPNAVTTAAAGLHQMKRFGSHLNILLR